MKYKPTDTPIPQDKRAEINEKILMMIDSTVPDHISKEDVFNAYTGIGGLHGLNRKDYANYHEFSSDKKDFEQGQFFTAAQVIEAMVKDLGVGPMDTVCDLACGAGAFFNHFKEGNCFGCDIDHKAVRVAKYLYPEAHIESTDIRFYDPKIKFDYVVGNPPFNLRWEYKKDSFLSQHFFCLKAAGLLKPGGILMCIVPDSYLKDEFFTKGMIAEIDEQFNFLFQYQLPAAAFKNMGVAAFNTKVVCFQRKAEALAPVEYGSTYIQMEEAAELLQATAAGRHAIRTKLNRELLQNFNDSFGYRVKKYIYEIKMHKVLQPHLPKALAKLEEFNNQERPEGMKYEDWDGMKLTEAKVLHYLKRIMKMQSRMEVDTYRMVQDKYGLRLKAYSRKAAIRMKKLEPVTNWRFNDLVLAGAEPVPGMTKGQIRSLKRRQRDYMRQFQNFKDMKRSIRIDTYLDKFRFYNADRELCKFNTIQKNDLGLIMQKDYAILSWQQGSGKTPAAAVWAREQPMQGTFIIGPALAINLTWVNFMKLHKKKYVNVKTLADIRSITPDMFVLISLDYVSKYQRQLRRHLKVHSNRVNLIFDESDEITNPHSKRTLATLNVFRRARRKLLATGTTTRNNITELYSQLELLYNNSVNLTCFCAYVYREEWEDKVKDIKKRENSRYRKPFPPRGGSVLFKECFNPAKTTVFGIQQHNQSIYNEESLRKILEYTIITRKFKEIAGDKYRISNTEIRQNAAEERVYAKIVKDLNEILPYYFASTGNARKDAALRVVRQMQLLINATSMPQNFKEYTGGDIPNKAKEIFREVEEHLEKIAIGCTSLSAVEWYAKQIQERFPFRQVFVVKGDVAFNKRGTVTAEFEATADGILICTQQSLKSSVNIPSCSRVLIESKQWNIPKIEQFFFRFIRYDSPNNTDVVFISYKNTIEVNLMALLMVKERLNDYIKTLEYKTDSDIYEEYDIDLDILNSLITKEEDSKGNVAIKWGKAELVA